MKIFIILSLLILSSNVFAKANNNEKVCHFSVNSTYFLKSYHKLKSKYMAIMDHLYSAKDAKANELHMEGKISDEKYINLVKKYNKDKVMIQKHSFYYIDPKICKYSEFEIEDFEALRIEQEKALKSCKDSPDPYLFVSEFMGISKKYIKSISELEREFSQEIFNKDKTKECKLFSQLKSTKILDNKITNLEDCNQYISQMNSLLKEKPNCLENKN